MDKAKLIAMLTLVFIPLMLVIPAWAQSDEIEPSNFGGLDVVLIIDQSGSMSGCPYWPDEKKCPEEKYPHPRPNDPQELRLYSPRFVVDFLATDTIYFNKEAVHRVAAISFGTQARVDLPLVEIGPHALEQWEAQRSEVKPKFQARALGDTDFKQAFELAKKIFDQAPSVGTGARKRVIFLLTDGEPYVEPAEESATFNLTGYLYDLESYLKRSLPGIDCKLYVVAMNDFTKDYWRTMEQFWVKVAEGHNIHKLYDNEDVPLVFTDILDELIPRLTGIDKLEVGPVSMPPYLTRAIFTFYKSSPDVQVIVRRANKTEVQLADKDVEYHVEDGPIERLALINPEPGMWEIVKPMEKARVRIRREKLFAEVKMVEPSAPPAQYSQVEIAYNVIDSTSGELVQEHPEYPLMMDVTLTEPDAITTSLEVLKESTGVYATIQPVTVDQAGDYKVKVVGRARDPEGNEFEVFSDDRGHFNVYAVELIRFALIEPQDNARLPIHASAMASRAESVEAKWQVISEDKVQPLDPQLCFEGDLAKVFDLTLTNTKGVTQTVASVISVAEPPTDGIFSAMLGNLGEGQYTLEVSLNPARLRHGYNVHPDNLTQTVSFERYEDPTRKMLIAAAKGTGVSAILILLLALFWLWLITRHPAQGTLIFKEPGGKEVHKIPFSAKKYNRMSFKKGLPNILGIKEVRVRHGAGQDGITLTVKDRDGKPMVDNAKLSKNSPVAYLGSAYTVEYEE